MSRIDLVLSEQSTPENRLADSDIGVQFLEKIVNVDNVLFEGIDLESIVYCCSVEEYMCIDALTRIVSTQRVLVDIGDTEH